MKKVLIFCFLAIYFNLSAIASYSTHQEPNALQLSHKTKYSVEIIKEGEIIKVNLKNDEVFTGKLTDVKENSIVLSNREIKFDDISKITLKKKTFTNLLISIGLFALGVILLIIGISAISWATEVIVTILFLKMGLDVFGILAGILLMLAGGIYSFVNRKSYNTKDWEIKPFEVK